MQLTRAPLRRLLKTYYAMVTPADAASVHCEAKPRVRPFSTISSESRLKRSSDDPLKLYQQKNPGCTLQPRSCSNGFLQTSYYFAAGAGGSTGLGNLAVISSRSFLAISSRGASFSPLSSWSTASFG